MGTAFAQDMPISYDLGEKYPDRYKYSNLRAIRPDGHGGTLLIRAYYTGIVLRPKGYFIEHYDSHLQLIGEYNYKLKEADLVGSLVANGQVHLVFLTYDPRERAYVYTVHSSPMTNMGFTPKKLLSVPAAQVARPLAKNHGRRYSSSSFRTSALFDTETNAFAVSVQFKKDRQDRHVVYLFDSNLVRLGEHDLSAQASEKNHAFEHVAFSEDLKEAYLVGKTYFKKKRFATGERRFRYEILRLAENGTAVNAFDDPGRFPEALIPVRHGHRLQCVGFYADRKDKRYNGLVYFDMDLKNLVFKNVELTEEGAILFNAEEYFVTSSMQSNGSGGRVQVDRHHYNDLVCAKLDAQGNMLWARNINKTEVTQGDGAYVSYSSFSKGGDTYFFIATAAERPQLLPGDRLLFKQGYGRNRNFFAIKLDSQGQLSYKKIIDDKEARLPLLVAMPLIDKKQSSALFYAKSGGKKQLIKVVVDQ